MGRDGWFDGVARNGPGQREQVDAEVAQLLEQAVQRGLVDDGPADDGGAVVPSGEGHPVEPGRPVLSEVPADADLVPREAPVSGVRLPGGRLGGAVVGAHEVNVRSDLVSAHHTMW